MKKTIELRLLPQDADNELLVRQKVATSLRLTEAELSTVVVRRKSIDARGRVPVIQLSIDVWLKGELPPVEASLFELLADNVAQKDKVLVIGAGPAGYFAALELIELGLCPIVIDRGKDVQARRRDLKAIQQDGHVNPDSNYCFGEGGAGTYSDGKLYTRSTKRGDIYKVLTWLVEHGANPEIMVEAHPHIGSNKLPQIIAAIRQTITERGGQVLFNAKVTDFVVENQKLKSVILQTGEHLEAQAFLLATGHSARDIFEVLHQRNILIESKPFALGVRIEHQQEFVDRVQYKQSQRPALLPAASYGLVCQAEGRGVFSFCMCPGGLIVPAATSPGEIVVNGMSMSRRDSKYANSGFVVSVEEADYQHFSQYGPLAAMAYQQQVEQIMFQAGNGSQQAPAQRATDFVNKKLSAQLNASSYIPGLFSAPLHQLLPMAITQRLQIALRDFDKKMPGFLTSEANLVGTESRTSSPVRIPRDATTLMHPQIHGLFPCGEGAGFAGGIISAAMDGQRVAQAIALFLKKT